MPNFFGTRAEQSSPYPDILGGDWKAQVNALRDYVWRIGGGKGITPGGAPPATEMVRTVVDTTNRAPEPNAPGKMSFK
jgi:hypothetical protein